MARVSNRAAKCCQGPRSRRSKNCHNCRNWIVQFRERNFGNSGNSGDYGNDSGGVMAVRRGVWIVLVLVILAVAVSAMGLVAMALFVGHEPQVGGNSALVLKIGGN